MGKTIQIMIDKRGAVTNGDVIKAVFPKIEIARFKHSKKTHIFEGGTKLNNLIGECDWDWWNSPYKAESEE